MIREEAGKEARRRILKDRNARVAIGINSERFILA